MSTSHVLVVDDEADIRALIDELPRLAALLEGFSGSDIAVLAHEIRLATLKENLNSITLLTSEHVITRKLHENQCEASATYEYTTAASDTRASNNEDNTTAAHANQHDAHPSGTQAD